MSDVLVIGAGPAGCAAAIALSRVGAPPLLIEREAAAAEKVCGEFLAADALARLAALDVDARALGAAPITRLLLAAGRRDAALPLPFAAFGLPRATLDAALRARAIEAGATIRQAQAVEARPHARGWQLRLAGGETLVARGIVLATGKHELRGVARPPRGGAIGVKLPLDGVPIGDAIALLACRGGYAGLQPRPDGGANLCAALDPRAPGVAEAARDPHAFLAHVLRGSATAERLLRDARPALPRPLTIAGLPYGFRARGGAAGLYRAGDQLSVIPSLCGDGIAMALASGVSAAAAIRAGGEAAMHHAAWSAGIALPMRLAGLLGLLVAHAPGLLVRGASVAPRLARWAAWRTRAAEA